MSLARPLFAPLLLCTACRGDFQSLDSAMGELVDALPETLWVSAADVHVCSTNGCFETPHDHRIELSLRPVQPARRNQQGDAIDLEGTFRLVRLEPDHEELLAEGTLLEGTVLRLKGTHAQADAWLKADFGTLWLSAEDGEAWGSPSLELRP